MSSFQRDNRPPTVGISKLMFLNGTDTAPDAATVQRSSVGPMMSVLVIGGLLWFFIQEVRGK